MNKKLQVYVFPVGEGKFQAMLHPCKGVSMHGAARKTVNSAKQSFSSFAKYLKIPRIAWEFYYPKRGF